MLVDAEKYTLTMCSQETSGADENTRPMSELIEKIGSDAICTAITIENIEYHCKQEYSNKPYLMFQIVRNFIKTLSSDDPTYLHFYLARQAILAVDEKLINDTDIIDQLARELIKQAKIFYAQLIIPEPLKHFFDDKNTIFTIEECPEYINELFIENACFSWDKKWANILKNNGYSREEFIDALAERKNRFKQYKEDDRIAIGFWVNLNSELDKPFFHSDAFIILAETLLRNKILNRIEFKNKNVSAITTTVFKPIAQIQSQSADLKNNDDSISFYHKGQLAAQIELVMIPAENLQLILNGAKELNSLCTFRFLRFLITETFELKASGNSDFRILRFPGAAKEIAARLGLKSSTDIEKIKSIIHALDHFKFRFVGSNGVELVSRLISLGTIAAQSRFSRQEGYEITVLPPLLPYRINEERNAGIRESFLIPILVKEPSFIGHSMYHARLCILQLMILEEFVNQAVTLEKDGFIKLSHDKWIEFFHRCKLPIEYPSKSKKGKTYLEDIRNEWIGKNGWLELMGSNTEFYTLKGEDKALKFIKELGKKRQSQSDRALSAMHKSNKKCK